MYQKHLQKQQQQQHKSQLTPSQQKCHHRSTSAGDTTNKPHHSSATFAIRSTCNFGPKLGANLTTTSNSIWWPFSVPLVGAPYCKRQARTHRMRQANSNNETTTTTRTNNNNNNNNKWMGYNLSMTPTSLLLSLSLMVLLCILITLGDAASSSGAGRGKSLKHQSTKVNFLNNHQNTKPTSGGSPIKFISIKRATPAAINPARATGSSEAPIPPSSAPGGALTSFLLASSGSPSTESASAVALVSKQLAATLISAAASSLAQSATESVIKAATGSKGRPSKVYNLPMKFVSNGQPNHFVTGLKQQLATIKKGSPRKTGKTNSKLGSKGPVYKHNSKFIYLPLKYLSNAKPYMIKKNEY